MQGNDQLARLALSIAVADGAPASIRALMPSRLIDPFTASGLTHCPRYSAGFSTMSRILNLPVTLTGSPYVIGCEIGVRTTSVWTYGSMPTMGDPKGVLPPMAAWPAYNGFGETSCSAFRAYDASCRVRCRRNPFSCRHADASWCSHGRFPPSAGARYSTPSPFGAPGADAVFWCATTPRL